MSQHLGRIEGWNDAKGYGFIRPLESAHDGSARTFVHVSSFLPGKRRPGEGDLVRYHVRIDERGRHNAEQVDLVTAKQKPSRASTRRGAGKQWPLRPLIALCAWGAVIVGWLFGIWPGLVPLLFTAMSLLSLLAYRHDKAAAQRNDWRTPENILHALDLLGGWPGGLLAQHVFRHKSNKTSFLAMFWITVILNCAALYWLSSSGKLDVLHYALIGS